MATLAIDMIAVLQIKSQVRAARVFPLLLIEVVAQLQYPKLALPSQASHATKY
ncbi:hypothetical protein H6G04_24980 [Calothrix membranacea FACHB-236]|nr:hypothetical protein [Calothrix membranacea FACHB-236]